MVENNFIVELQDVRKRYSRAKALDGITLNIKRGQILGLLGPNGSGKSTLLKTISGLVFPDSGDVLVEGQRPSYRTKAKVAFLPEIDYLYSWMTVKEIIDFVASFYSDWQVERAEELVKSLNIEKDQKIGNLSKGQRARLKLLLALSRNVPLVLLDEPLSGIDPPSRASIISSVVTEYRAGEQTIIFSTHEVRESESVFDDVVFLHKGKLKLYDSAENLRSQYGCSIQDLWRKVY